MVTITAAAVLLDMDGTLVDSRIVTERVWTEWSIAHGIPTATTLSVIHGRQGHESMAILLPERTREENLAENQLLLAAETAQLDGVVALPGAAALLDALVGLPHALVTSAPLDLAAARMGAAGLRMPDIVVSAADVVASKPHPEGFLTAARLLGVDAADCVVLEDSANGISAGLAADMRVIGIGPDAVAAAPTWTVATPAELAAGADGARIRIELAASVDA